MELKYWSASALSYRTLCEAPDDNFRVRLKEIRRDEWGWLNAARLAGVITRLTGLLSRGRPVSFGRLIQRCRNGLS